MPSERAASSTFVPFVTVTGLPSIVRVTDSLMKPSCETVTPCEAVTSCEEPRARGAARTGAERTHEGKPGKRSGNDAIEPRSRRHSLVALPADHIDHPEDRNDV